MEPAERLLHLLDAELRDLHESLHKSTEDKVAVELHHLVSTELARRGYDHGHADDQWFRIEVEIDKARDVDLDVLGSSLPLESSLSKESGMNRGDVTVVLTVNGYEMRVDPPTDYITLLTDTGLMAKHGTGDQSAHGHRGGGGGTATLDSSLPEAEGLSSIPVQPLDKATLQRISQSMSRRMQRSAYGDAYESAARDMQDNPTLGTVRAQTRWKSREKAVSDFKTLDPRSEDGQLRAWQVMALQGYVDGATGQRQLFSSPSPTLMDYVETGPSGIMKHGNHDQSTHGHRGGSYVAYSGRARKGMGDGVAMGDEDFDRISNPKLSYGAKFIEGRNPNGSPKWSAERQALHDKLISEHLAGLQPPEGQPTFVMLGGGPASGKTTSLQSGLLTGVPATKGAGRKAVEINADDLKEEIPEAASALGRLEKGQGTESDKVWASMSHEESSYLAKRMTAAAQERGLNIVLDGTGDNSQKSVESKIRPARALGYKVVGRYVTCSTDEAWGRAQKRAARSHRIVDEHVVRGTHKGVSAVFPAVAGLFDDVELVSNTGDAVKLIATGKRGESLDIKDPSGWKDFLAKAGE